MNARQKEKKKSSSAIFKGPCSHYTPVSKGAGHQTSMERKKPLGPKELKKRYDKDGKQIRSK